MVANSLGEIQAIEQRKRAASLRRVFTFSNELVGVGNRPPTKTTEELHAVGRVEFLAADCLNDGRLLQTWGAQAKKRPEFLGLVAHLLVGKLCEGPKIGAA